MDEDASRRWLTRARWVALAPAMFVAFFFTLAVSMALLGGLLKLPPTTVGLPCAAAWVATAWWVAPSHRKVVGGIAWILGAALAAPLSMLGDAPKGLLGWLTHWPYLATCASGLVTLVLIEAFARPHGSPPPLSGGQFFPAIKAGALSFLAALRRGVGGQAAHPTTNPNNAKTMNIKHLLTKSPLAKITLLILAALVGFQFLRAIAGGCIDVVQQDQRGLSLRLGQYRKTVEPGLHFKIPLVDSIQRISVKERQSYIEHVDAMTQDNVIMKVSLQFTYEVSDPKVYQLEITDPDRIIREFVQGKLRDIINSTTMGDVMKKRTELNARIMSELAERQTAYGIHFKLVQIQGTYPPPEVQDAIKQRMVVEQRTVSAKEEATQKQILADANLYQAQKETEAAKFKIEETAKAQKESIRMLFEEFGKHEALGMKYLDLLTAQELKENSKWIISGGQAPAIHLDPVR